MASAQELLVDGQPRSLRCRGLTLKHLGLDRDGVISRFSTLSDLNESGGITVTYLTSAKFAGLLRKGEDIVVITRDELQGCLQPGNIAFLTDDDPHDAFYSSFAAAVASFDRLQSYISPQARIHPSAVIEENVHIEAGAVIGANSVVMSNSYVGNNVVIKPNATIGGDGFENAQIDGRHSIVPHVGGVWLSAGVQVGSSTCIDKGLFGDFTFLGENTTIDNLVHFAHSAKTGKDCSLVACCEVSGAVELGDGVWIGPNVSINQGLKLGNHCYVGTGAVVTRDLPAHSLAYGSPAKATARVCVCRAKLSFEANETNCAICARRFRLTTDGEVQRV